MRWIPAVSHPDECIARCGGGSWVVACIQTGVAGLLLPMTRGSSVHETIGARPALDSRLARYDSQLLADETIQDLIRRAGYEGVPNVAGPDTVRAVWDVAQDFLDRFDETWGDLFLTVGRIQDAALRSEITRRSADLVLPALAPLFVDGAHLFGSALQIKPPSPTSVLNAHQDSSLVDESEWLGIYVWLALKDTDGHTGGLRVLPGFHRFGNTQRTLNLPWQPAPYAEVLERESAAQGASGGVLLFDVATVHGSLPNMGPDVRLAANSFATSAGAPLVHFLADESAPPGTIEAYRIDVSFFVDADIMARPGPPHRFLGERPEHRIDWSVPEFERLCADAKADAR